MLITIIILCVYIVAISIALFSNYADKVFHKNSYDLVNKHWDQEMELRKECEKELYELKVQNRCLERTIETLQQDLKSKEKQPWQ
jgi:hypothetical protein